MHIVQIADAVFRDKPGGSRQYAREVARCLAEMGIQSTFVVPQINPAIPIEETVEGIRVIRYGGASPIARQLTLQNALRSLHTAHRIDAVIVHFAYCAFGYHCMSMFRSVPTLRIFHGPWDLESSVESPGGGLTRRVSLQAKHYIESLSLRRSHRVVALSEFMARDVCNRFSVPRRKVSVVPGGVNTRTFMSLRRDEARARFGLQSDEFVVFTVRRLANRMGLDLLLDAVAIARTSIPRLRVLVAGKGPLASSL